MRLGGTVGFVCSMLGAAVMADGCGAARVGRPALPTPDASIQAEISREAGVPWSAGRRLTWADFTASAPTTGAEGALTAYSLLYGVRCVGAAFQYDVSAVFLPRQSWVKPVVLADAGDAVRTLRHEQTHFDLTEVHARRLRRYLAGTYDACRSGDAGVHEGAERQITAEADAQRRYDAETRHGLDRPQQAAWDEDVTGWLKELGAFASARP